MILLSNLPQPPQLPCGGSETTDLANRPKPVDVPAVAVVVMAIAQPAPTTQGETPP